LAAPAVKSRAAFALLPLARGRLDGGGPIYPIRKKRPDFP